MGPVLKNDPAAYAGLVALLARAGMVRFDLHQKAVSPPSFFVGKDDEGVLQALFDCRQVNKLLRDPPPTLLATLETLTKLEITDQLYSSFKKNALTPSRGYGVLGFSR